LRRDHERVSRIADELHTSSYGETHTFTEVAQFGGGLVGLLNDLSGNPVPAPECNPANGRSNPSRRAGRRIRTSKSRAPSCNSPDCRGFILVGLASGIFLTRALWKR
jgi:hypothetical protein